MFFIPRFKLFLAYNLIAFWASILATKIHRFLPWFGAQNGSKKRPESFRKSFRFHCLSPGGHFGTPWLFLGSIFARLGALSGLIMAAGDVFCCQIVLGQVYLCLSVVIVTVISAPFKSRCARKCTNLLIFMEIHYFSNGMLPNLSITKHDFNLECKQKWSGNKVPTYTRVNERVGGIR